MKRRSFLKAGLVVSATAANCARQTLPGTRQALVVGAGPDRYNTAPGRFTLTTSRPNAHVGEPPVRPNTRFEATPCLFESWAHEGGGAYRAHLRPKVLFHDGTPFAADTFIESARQFIGARDFIGLDSASLRKVDDGTVRFRSKTGSALMVDNMTHPSASLFLPGKRTGTAAVGTGPYRMVRYEPNRLLEVERFEGYWGSRPRQARVIYRFLADPQPGCSPCGRAKWTSCQMWFRRCCSRFPRTTPKSTYSDRARCAMRPCCATFAANRPSPHCATFGGNANADPTFLLYNAFHTKTPWASYRFNAPGADVDARLNAARAGEVRESIVENVREAHRLIIDEHVAAIPILTVPAFVLTRTGVALDMFENVDWIDFGDGSVGA